MANDILTLFRESWPWLFVTVCGLVTFIYLSDKRSIDKRFASAKERDDKLEATVSDLQVNHVTRVEFHDKVDSVQKVFREDHKDLFSAISESNKTLREDISELRHMMMAIIGRRDEDNH